MRLRATKLASLHHPQFRLTELWARAGEVPSFHIAPARTGHARDLITGNLLGTYNSASPAWAVGPDGVLALPAANAPVIEYDPTTLSCLGARIWGVVINNLLQSENLATTWTIFNATPNTNTATAPNGTLTADKIEETATTSQHRASQASAGGATTSAVTFSVFVKAAERTKIRLSFSSVASWSGGNGAAVIFDLAAGSGSVDSSTPTAFGIQAYPNGWYRCWITGTPTVSLTPTANAFLYTTSISYLGTAGSGAFLWGGQLNPGLIAPYVPTTTTTASSTADVWSITGADFSGIFNNTQGTIYANFARNVSTAATAYLFAANQVASAANRIDININAFQAVNPRTVVSGSAVSSIAAGTYTSNSNASIAYAYSVGDYATSLNGSSVIQDSTAGPLPSSLGEFYIGSLLGGSSFNGYIRELAIFRSRRPNTNLQAMTQ